MKYLKFINKFFAKHLLACNTVSSAVIMTTGDIIVQKITRPEEHQWDRTYKMGFVGATMGPLEHFFYKNLDIVFPKTDKRTVFKKIFADQTIAAPFFICSFFFLCNVWEKKPKESIDEIKAKFLDVYKVDLLVWPAAQYINFLYLPPQYRVLYVSGISVIYTAFLSYIKHQGLIFEK
ncbi:mpv17-like protein 2 [Planococcus citri]|uniref:mpv17-like protein 2 n=1 Tax=Planococcus citri TaxID=170843 RepID=UPI0031F93AC9